MARADSLAVTEGVNMVFSLMDAAAMLSAPNNCMNVQYNSGIEELHLCFDMQRLATLDVRTAARCTALLF
jgi:hypothetical protein